MPNVTTNHAITYTNIKTQILTVERKQTLTFPLKDLHGIILFSFDELTLIFSILHFIFSNEG